MYDTPYPGDAVNKMVDESPRFKKVVNNVGPSAVGHAVSLISGSPNAGRAAHMAASAANAASPDSFAKGVGHAAFLAGTVALTVAATPVFVVALPILAVASLFKKKD